MSVRYSSRAAPALALLKRPYNDVDIFVEDTGNHNMWLLMVRRMLPPGTRLASVNMLGGRKAVEGACRADQAITGRKKLYIIDGDLDWLLGKPKPRLKYLYRLRAYSIENILISQEALIQIGLEYSPTSSEVQVEAMVGYPALLTMMQQTLTRLFIAYAVAYSLDPSIRTVRLPVDGLYVNSPQGPVLSVVKARARIISIYRQAVGAAGLAATRERERAIGACARALLLEQIVSGKDYVLPFVWLRLRGTCGYGGSHEQFKVALARHFDPQAERYLARRLRNLKV